MRRIKRIHFIVALALAVALTLGGCGKDNTAADEAPGQMSPTTGGVVEDGAPVDTTSAPTTP